MLIHCSLCLTVDVRAAQVTAILTSHSDRIMSQINPLSFMLPLPGYFVTTGNEAKKYTYILSRYSYFLSSLPLPCNIFIDLIILGIAMCCHI